jgi:hypothetical protein
MKYHDAAKQRHPVEAVARLDTNTTSILDTQEGVLSGHETVIVGDWVNGG